MRKSSVLLYLTFLILSVLALSNSTRLNKKHSPAIRFLEDYATASGNIPLTLGDSGLFVHVDFSNYSNDASETDDDNTDYGNMVLALYTDQTFVVKNCLDFQNYCLKYNDICSQASINTTNVTFPYFEISGNPITPKIFLDYSHWSLNSTAILSTDCSGSYNVGGYGLLGMGVSPLSLANFLGRKPNFAINVAKSLSNGTFAFNVDLSKSKSDQPTAVLPSNNLWHVSSVDAITIKDDAISTNASLIFDLGSDSIGLPQLIHTQVLEEIKKNPAVGGCSIGDDFRPICNFSGDIRNLPTVTLNIGTQSVDIPPEVYVVQTQDNYFYYDPITLKLKVLSTNDTQGMLVMPEYENYIILGYPAMSYYYTVFEASHIGGGTISLYPSSEYEDASDLTWLFIIVGIFGLITIGIVFYLFDKKHKKKVVETPLLGQQAVKEKAVRRLH